MELQEHCKKLENMYLSSPIREFYQHTIKISDKYAEVTTPVENKLFHAANAIHGSVYFKMLDDAAFFAANSVVTDVFVLTTNFSINLIRPVSSGLLIAKGELVFSSKNLFIAESKLYDSDNKLIAFGTGHFAKSQMQLNEDLGYKL